MTFRPPPRHGGNGEISVEAGTIETSISFDLDPDYYHGMAKQPRGPAGRKPEEMAPRRVVPG